MTLNNKHCLVFRSLLERKTDIRFSAVKTLVEALGGEVTNKSGSKRKVALGGVMLRIDEPHNNKPMGLGRVEMILAFFNRAGVRFADVC